VSGDERGRAMVIGALVVSVVLVVAYLAAGGASYAPAKTQDPCKPRPWREPEGLQEIAQQFSLSALDGAACELGVSRETLARALANPTSRERFRKRYGIDDAELARAIRAGLERAVTDAENAGALSPLVAEPLRAALRSIPIDRAIELVKDARSLLDNTRGILGPAQGLLEQFLP
jgi:hypothetical protein